MKYRKKPIVVDALQWDGDMYKMLDFSDGEADDDHFAFRADGIERTFTILTKEGLMTADIGDWVIKEPFATEDRRFYPCKPDIFEQTYELA